MSTWDTEQYLKFKNERTQPFYDLISRIQISNPESIVDVGCGPGNSTFVIEQRWPNADISGFDSSTEMLKIATETSSKVNWFQADVKDWRPDTHYDVIFSNAALHWISDHERLLPKLMSYLNNEGALAVQMPAHYNSPSHQLLLEVAKQPEWCSFTESACQLLSMEPQSFYYNVLDPLASKVEMWETEYVHIMDNVETIIEWFHSTGLRPFMESLPRREDKEKFKHELLAKYNVAYPQQQNGKVLFPFRRFFFIAYK